MHHQSQSRYNYWHIVLWCGYYCIFGILQEHGQRPTNHGNHKQIICRNKFICRHIKVFERLQNPETYPTATATTSDTQTLARHIKRIKKTKIIPSIDGIILQHEFQPSPTFWRLRLPNCLHVFQFLHPEQRTQILPIYHLHLR